MTLLILLFVSLVQTTHAAEAPNAKPEARSSSPSTRDRQNEYSIRTQLETCTSERASKCEISTFVVSKELASEALVWERRIYFQHYDPAKPVETQAITATSIKLEAGKLLKVKNSRGDIFELAGDHGHLKKPKVAREYTK